LSTQDLSMTNTQLKKLFKRHKEDALFGRYIHAETIKPLLVKHAKNFKIEVVGQSVLKDENYKRMLSSNNTNAQSRWSKGLYKIEC